jgi:hypothetical protein
MIDKSKFANKKDLIAHIVANKSEYSAFKKSITKHSDSILHSNDDKIGANKVISNFSSDDLNAGIIKRTIVGNTYGWMDSHDDVHIKGIFTKSISESENIFHLHDHLYQIAAKVGTPIKIYEQNVSLTDLGLNKIGFTTCLLMDSEIKKVFNPMIFDEYYTKQINQHSVGMIYVKLFLCVNDAEYKEEFANWNTYKGSVINLDKAEENGYFWAVTEAKLKEISCVLLGSNELTPTLNVKSEPLKDTQKIEPDKTTQIAKQKLSINQSIY